MLLADAAASVERTRPPLNHASVNIAVQSDAWTAICGDGRGVKQGLEATFDKVQVGGADSGLLRKWFFELASLKLEFGSDSDVEICVADDGAGGGVGVGQDCEVEVRAEIALKSETRAANKKSVEGAPSPL